MTVESAPKEHLPKLVEELRRVLSGIYRLELAGGAVHVRIGPLPGRTIAAGLVRNDELWLFMDREKPRAVDHARRMLAEHPELMLHADGETFVITEGALEAQVGEVADLILHSADGWD